MLAPYEFFGQVRMVPVRVWRDLAEVPDPEVGWDDELWVERGEDWYALMSDQLCPRRVRVVTREDWLKSRPVSPGHT